MVVPSILRAIAIREQLDRRQAAPDDGVDANVSLIIGVAVFSIVLVTISIILRFVFRNISKAGLKADDYWMVVAAFFTIADAACYLAAIQFGFGQHIYLLEPTQLLAFFKIVFATFLIYGVAVTAVKISVLLFYRRIFPNQKFRTWLYTLGVLSIVWFLAITFTSIFQCNPVSKAWTGPPTPGTCIPYLDIFIGMQVANIVLDISILVLPIRAVMGLQMTKANKISVAGTFSLAGLSIIFAVVRLAILVMDMTQTDITYATATANWSLLEPAVEIFSACLPCFTPILKASKYLSKLRSSRGGSSGSSNNKRSMGSSLQSAGDSQIDRRNRYQGLDEDRYGAAAGYGVERFDGKRGIVVKTDLRVQQGARGAYSEDHVPLRQMGV